MGEERGKDAEEQKMGNGRASPNDVAVFVRGPVPLVLLPHDGPF